MEGIHYPDMNTTLTVLGDGGMVDGQDQSTLHCSDPVQTPAPSHCHDSTTDAGDESLQRYKESLGLTGGNDLSDPNDPRVCIIMSLAMETSGRNPVVIDLSEPGSEATLKDHPFRVKEGSRFTMVASFKVQHELLSGLRYVQIVKRKGIPVSKDHEMLVSSPVRGLLPTRW